MQQFKKKGLTIKSVFDVFEKKIVEAKIMARIGLLSLNQITVLKRVQ